MPSAYLIPVSSLPRPLPSISPSAVLFLSTRTLVYSVWMFLLCLRSLINSSVECLYIVVVFCLPSTDASVMTSGTTDTASFIVSCFRHDFESVNSSINETSFSRGQTKPRSCVTWAHQNQSRQKGKFASTRQCVTKHEALYWKRLSFWWNVYRWWAPETLVIRYFLLVLLLKVWCQF